MNIAFATTNTIKLSEAVALLDHNVHGVELHLEELQSLAVRDVVRHKLRQVVDRAVHEPVLVEDTGLEVDGWNGYPGALVRWATESWGNERFAAMARDHGTAAGATATSCVGIAYQGRTALWTGSARGHLVHPRGELGGWTPIFEVDGTGKTLAELNEPERLRVTMRAEPLRSVERWLADLGSDRPVEPADA